MFESLYGVMDDCNLKFVDQVCLKRFLKKCGVLASKKIIISLIRRFDLDQDCRLSKDEFFEAILPIEKYT